MYSSLWLDSQQWVCGDQKLHSYFTFEIRPYLPQFIPCHTCHPYQDLLYMNLAPRFFFQYNIDWFFFSCMSFSIPSQFIVFLGAIMVILSIHWEWIKAVTVLNHPRMLRKLIIYSCQDKKSIVKMPLFFRFNISMLLETSCWQKL